MRGGGGSSTVSCSSSVPEDAGCSLVEVAGVGFDSLCDAVHILGAVTNVGRRQSITFWLILAL